MNKIFKTVYNAARDKWMVVNETTSSVQTGKKAAVAVAVLGALASGMSVAAPIAADNVTSESASRYYGVGALGTSAEYTDVTIVDSTKADVDRQYGVYTTGDQASLTLKGNTNITFTKGEVRGWRLYGGKVTVEGDATTTVTGAQPHASGGLIGLDVWEGTEVTFKKAFAVDYSGNTKGQMYALQNWGSKDNHNTVTFEGKATLAINNATDYDLKDNTTQSTAGVIAFSSTTNFNGDASITATAYQSVTGVKINGNPSDPGGTVNFNGGLTTIAATSLGESILNGEVEKGAAGVVASGTPNKVTFNGGDVKLNIVANEWSASGLQAQYGAQLEGTANFDVSVKGKIAATGINVIPYDGVTCSGVNFSGAVDVKTQVTGEGAKATALYVEGQEAQAKLTGSSVKLQASGANAQGVNARYGATVDLGSDTASSVSIDVESDGTGDGNLLMGIQAREEGTKVTVKGQSFTTTVTAKGTDTAYGVLVQGNAENQNTGTGLGTIAIDAANTVITATAASGSAHGLVAMAEGQLAVNGNLEVNAANAITARGRSVVKVNQAGGKNVVLNGDINFNKGVASGTDAWADVYVTLDTADSVWNGTVKATWDVPATAEDFAGSKLHLTLANGAQWNPIALESFGELTEPAKPAMFRMARNTPTGGQMGLDITKLTLDNGTVNLPDGVQVGVGELEGEGNVNIGVGEDGTSTAGMTVENAADGAALDVTLMNADLTEELTSDDLTAEQAKAIVEAVGGEEVATTATIKEGFENGDISIGTDGTIVESENTLVVNSLDLASAAPLAINRLLMNDVRKRLGDLRSAQGTHGVWARYDGGKLSGAMGLENDFHTLQVGIDTMPTADAARFGVALSYTKSDADIRRGGAEMDAFGLAFYGTKFYDNGMFVDVIGRLAKADTDVTVDGQVKGAMDNLALSLSGEAGWRFDMTERHYVEPQVEVTYTRVDNGSLKLNNGTTYEFDAVDSLLGRAGFAAGFTCPNGMGDVYVRASVVHEFLGDASIGLRGDKLKEVNGSDTWFEYGIGANFNVNKNTYVYADVERTSGAALDEDWRANVGVRFSF